MSKRIKYLLWFIVLAAAAVVIALFVHDSFVRPYVFDALIVAVLYCFIRIFIPEGVKLLPLYVFLFAAAVEAVQLLDLVKLFNAENIPLLAKILGRTFDVADIVCYAVGCAGTWVSQLIGAKRK